MSTTNPLQGRAEGPELRKAAGRYVRECRERAGLTQLELSKRLGLDYYTLISQVELGKTRVPPERMKEWAEHLNVPPKAFAERLLQNYDPFTWSLLFGTEH